ncbi:MAG: hypothetical protein ACO2PN_01855 [Pyrobaculum sp.]
MEKPHRCLWLAEESRGETASGIGKNVAWQTPIHREAVRRRLKRSGEDSR